MAGQPYAIAWHCLSWDHGLHKQSPREVNADSVHCCAAASTCHTRRDPGLGSLERKRPVPPELVSCHRPSGCCQRPTVGCGRCQALLSFAGGSGWALPFCGATGAASMQSSLWRWHSSSVSEGICCELSSGTHNVKRSHACQARSASAWQNLWVTHTRQLVAHVAKRGCNARLPCSACPTRQGHLVLPR